MGAGVGALYRGAYPSILRALPSYAASFWGYEKTLELIEKWKTEMIRGGEGGGKGVGVGLGVGKRVKGAGKSWGGSGRMGEER